jgi:hypothetical protein
MSGPPSTAEGQTPGLLPASPYDNLGIHFISAIAESGMIFFALVFYPKLSLDNVVRNPDLDDNVKSSICKALHRMVQGSATPQMGFLRRRQF